MEYNVVEATSLSSLSYKINDAILSGWEPFGGVSVTQVGFVRPYLIYHQTIIKKR